MVRVASSTAAPASATTSERIFPEISPATTAARTASTMHCGTVMANVTGRALYRPTREEICGSRSVRLLG
jgi:hypothetical protein